MDFNIGHVRNLKITRTRYFELTSGYVKLNYGKHRYPYY